MDVRLDLHTADLCVFLDLVGDLDALPGEFALQQVQHQVSQGLQVIAAALFVSQM